MSKLGKRHFGRTVEEGLKPSALRIRRGEKKNFNDIINKYYPNRILKNKKKEESKTIDPDVKFYLCSKMKRVIESNKNRQCIDDGTDNINNDMNNDINNDGVDDVNNVPLMISSNSQKGENLNEIRKQTDDELRINPTDIERDKESSKEVLEISKGEHDIQKYKNRLHKKIWLSLKKNNEKEFEHYFNELNKYPLKDEVSYSILLHGNLIISKGENIKESFNILEEMKQKKIHCSLIRFNERLLYSYYELLKFNAAPNFHQWIKVLRTVWFTSALVKARRQKFILRKIKKIKMNKSVSLNNFHDTFNIHNLQTLYIDKRDPLLPTHTDLDNLNNITDKYLG